MSAMREPIDVRVSNQTLRFGDTSLPLHTVRRATTTELEPDRGLAVRTYAVAVAKWLIPAAFVAAVIPEAVAALVNVGALTVFTVSTATLARRLRLRLHELTVETTTGTHRVLVGTDPRTVAALAFRITDALHDPAVEFHIRTENVDPPLTHTGPRRKTPHDAST